MFFAVFFEINFTYFYYYTGFVDLQNEFWYFHEFTEFLGGFIFSF